MFVLHPYRMAFTFTNNIYLSLFVVGVVVEPPKCDVFVCIFIRYVQMRIVRYFVSRIVLVIHSHPNTQSYTQLDMYISAKESNLLILTENRKKLKSHKRDTHIHTHTPIFMYLLLYYYYHHHHHPNCE